MNVGRVVLDNAVLLMTLVIYLAVLSALTARQWSMSKVYAAGAKNDSNRYNNSAQLIQIRTAMPWLFIVVIIPIICLTFMLVAKYTLPDGTSFETFDTFQLLTPVSWIAAFAVLLQLARVWPLLGKEGRRVAGALLIAFVTLPVITKVYESVVLLRNPENWHEFADNRAIFRR